VTGTTGSHGLPRGQSSGDDGKHAPAPGFPVFFAILTCAYHVLERDEPYHDLGPDWLSERNQEAHTRRLVNQLEHLGYAVSLAKPAA
jgi:hypothetical protein